MIGSAGGRLRNISAGYHHQEHFHPGLTEIKIFDNIPVNQTKKI